MTSRHSVARGQSGFAHTIAIVAIGVAAALGIAGSYAFRQAKSTSITGQKEQVRDDLGRIAKQLILQSSPDGSNIMTAPAFTAPPTGPAPTSGGRLPQMGIRNKTPQGDPFGYCPVKLGDTGGAGNRIATGGTPGGNTILFALIGPGTDRAYQTSCAQALAGSAEGDDQIFKVRHHDALRIRFEAAAAQAGHRNFQAAEVSCAASGKLFQPFATGKDASGCK